MNWDLTAQRKELTLLERTEKQQKRWWAGRNAVSCAANGEVVNTGSGTMRVQEAGLMTVSPWQIWPEVGRIRTLLLEQLDVLKSQLLCTNQKSAVDHIWQVNVQSVFMMQMEMIRGKVGVMENVPGTMENVFWNKLSFLHFHWINWAYCTFNQDL